MIDKDGVWRTRSIKAMPKEEKLSFEEIRKITAVPWDAKATTAAVRKPVVDKEFLPGDPVEEIDVEGKRRSPLDPILLQADFKKHGWTLRSEGHEMDCKGCQQNKNRNVGEKPTNSALQHMQRKNGGSIKK